jgi:hypothetical protein
MFQKKTLGILFVTAFVLISVAYAGKVELTTYYPAPFGEYEDLQTNTMKYNTLKATRMAVAQTNNDAQLDAADQPNRDGDIRLGAQGGDPRTWPAGAGGQIAFSANEGALYLYNGSAWVPAGGGGGGCYTAYAAWNIASLQMCAPGFTSIGNIGNWGFCQMGAEKFYVPPGGGDRCTIFGGTFVATQNTNVCCKS